MIGRTFQQTVRPSAPPIDLNSARLDPHSWRMALIGGGIYLGVGMLLVALWALVAPHEYDDPGRFRLVMTYTSGSLGLLLLFLGAYALLLPYRRERLHERRVEAWNKLTMQERLDQGGVEVIQEVTEWELQPEHPGHVLLAAIAVQARLAQPSNRVPYSTRALQEGAYIGSKAHLVKLGEMTAPSAERMAARFAELGIIQGRDGRTRAPGEWVPESFEDVIEIFAENWRKTSR